MGCQRLISGWSKAQTPALPAAAHGASVALCWPLDALECTVQREVGKVQSLLV